jgi:hypothetical protein
MTPHDPIEFVRRLVSGRTQLAGNRVQLEDTTGTPYSGVNPLPTGGVVVLGAAVAIDQTTAGGNHVEPVDAGGTPITETTGHTMKVSGTVAVTGAYPTTQPVSIAASQVAVGALVDGADITQGLKADAAVVGDNDGTVNAHLRGIGKMLNDVWVSASHWLQVQIQAGENHLGSTGGIKTSVAVAFTRPAPTTAYTALDCVGQLLTVSDATNASPIVVTTGTQALADGDPVTISGVTGNTNANGNYYAKVTGYGTTTFGVYTDKALTTPRAGNSNYVNGGSVAVPLRFVNMGRLVAGTGYTVKAQIWTDQKACTARLKLHLFNTPPTGILDNIAYGALWASRTNRVGQIVFPALAAEDPTASDTASALASLDASGSFLPLAFVCGAADRDLYGIMETLDAFTPAAGQLFYVKLANEVD